MITIDEKRKEEGEVDNQPSIGSQSTSLTSEPFVKSNAVVNENETKVSVYVLIPDEEDGRKKQVINDLLLPLTAQGVCCHELDAILRDFIKGSGLTLLLNPFIFSDFANGFDSRVEGLSNGKSEDDVKSLLSTSAQDYAKQFSKDIAKFLKENGLSSAVVVNKKMIRKANLIDFYNKVDGMTSDDAKEFLLSSAKKLESLNVETSLQKVHSSLSELIQELAITVSEDDIDDNLADLESSIKSLTEKINTKRSKLTEAVLGKTILTRN